MVQTSSFPHRHGQLCLREWIREQGWQRLGIEELRPLCQSIIDSFPDEVAAIQNGKTKVMMRLVGEAMRKGQGRADPEQITALLHDLVVAKA
ncbi:carbon-nitrogen ligase [Malassezia pachydermatis]